MEKMNMLKFEWDFLGRNMEKLWGNYGKKTMGKLYGEIIIMGNLYWKNHGKHMGKMNMLNFKGNILGQIWKNYEATMEKTMAKLYGETIIMGKL